MINTTDPGFSSDIILEEYARLNEMDWSRANDEDDEQIENENEDV